MENLGEVLCLPLCFSIDVRCILCTLTFVWRMYHFWCGKSLNSSVYFGILHLCMFFFHISYFVRGEMSVMKDEITRLKGGGKGQGSQNPDGHGKGKGQWDDLAIWYPSSVWRYHNRHIGFSLSSFNSSVMIAKINSLLRSHAVFVERFCSLNIASKIECARKWGSRRAVFTGWCLSIEIICMWNLCGEVSGKSFWCCLAGCFRS